MEEYEQKVEQNQKRNKKYIKEFTEWLNEKGLSKKTIRKHLDNVKLYINEYLNYYDVIKVEDGIEEVDDFLEGWFIEKCLFATKTSLKETAASLKKFYQYMSEYNYVKKEDYKQLCSVIKDNMDIYLEQLEAFDNGIYYDIWA